ncbi:hypothetical protein R1521_04050 [Rhizobium brockwellii]|uniref:Uncharacterized protein n=1 Tax=Rhizobium brockwellii TaxID=3019932 RepID=A0ABU3YFP8_9HYPH|nr:hypothetical protein [Rhizobium brockwellii]MDV4177684.1 hypothetical protein [Rhizobium brockwellii]MDV4184683.1 hypothetical protein [Rhizobium brockwellii]
MSIDTQTVAEMANAGIAFVASVRVSGGGETVVLPSNSIAEYVGDPQGFAAKHFGITKERRVVSGYLQRVAHCESG